MTQSTHPTDLKILWDDQKLTVEGIIPKVLDYSTQRRTYLTKEEAESIARQIHRAYKKYHDPLSYAGDFMIEFAGDSLTRIMSIADNLNVRALGIYYSYFYNCAPGDWRTKIK